LSYFPSSGILSTMEIPPVCHVIRRYDTPSLQEDIATLVEQRLDALLGGRALTPGAVVGVCAGSRGIHNLQAITRAAVNALRARSAKPVILPAMGSHGGATAEGQTAMLADPGIGITEATMGCPVDARMDTRLVEGDGPFPIHWSEAALACDHVIIINRVKPHTEIFGRPGPAEQTAGVTEFVHSGVLKMLAVGLGKKTGAETYHRQIPTPLGLGGAIMTGARRLIEQFGQGAQGKALGGLAIVENAHDETAALEAIPFDAADPTAAIQQELALLENARAWMPKLPLDTIHVLWIETMGKRISGTGLDTNIVNRNPYGYFPGERWRANGPSVYSIICSQLQTSSHGNAHGMGLADFITERLAQQIDPTATQINSLTAFSALLCSRPTVMPNDRDAIQAALHCSPAVATGRPGFVAIRDTLHPGDALVSPDVLEQIDTGQFDLPRGAEPRPIPFDAAGCLIWPD